MQTFKINSPYNNLINLKVSQGHFATTSSHINYYIDLTTLKARASEAKAVAKSMSHEYMATTIVDTIVCLDYTDVIGLQYKKPGAAIGYLQFETASGQMNNEKSGFWSENTFTYTDKEVKPSVMNEVVKYIKDTLETLKYGSISTNEHKSLNDELPEL